MAKLAPGAAEAVNSSLPLGHAQATWDIGMSAVFLASHGARCISGDTLVRQIPSMSLQQFLSKLLPSLETGNDV